MGQLVNGFQKTWLDSPKKLSQAKDSEGSTGRSNSTWGAPMSEASRASRSDDE